MYGAALNLKTSDQSKDQLVTLALLDLQEQLVILALLEQLVTLVLQVQQEQLVPTLT
jgi:hypothetical protein